MRLKRLTISGFKSFPRRTSITFSQGVSAIVGPNGSGKSNIVDAVRWVLGEQNPRLLRAGSMDDLIYRGNSSKAPRSAFVRLVLENSGKMAPPELESIPEIEIERVLFPSGEAKFRLNRKNCRLKDIRYLFLDTGAGARAYSIIDQGQVGVFVSMSPEERRMIVEEVAGISRYKARRAEASGRLRQTLQNLERLGDIMAEVERQAGSLRRQASRAQRFLRLRKEEEELFLFILKKKWSRVCKSEEELLDTRAVQAREMEDRQVKLSAVEASLDETGLVMEENRQELKAFKEEIGRLESEIEGLSLKLMDKEKELVLCRQTKASLRERLSDSVDRRTDALERLKTLKERMKKLSSALRVKEEEKERLETRLSRHLEDFSRRREDLEHTRDILVGLASEKAVLKSRKASLQDRKSGIGQRLSRLDRQREEADQDLERLGKQEAGLKERLGAVVDKIEQGQERLYSLRKQREEIEVRLSGLSERIGEHASMVDRLRVELETLSKMMSMRDQPGETSKEMLSDLNMDAVRLSDILSVEKGWEDAVETALGASVQGFFLRDKGIEAAPGIICNLRGLREDLGDMALLFPASFADMRVQNSPGLPRGISMLSSRILGDGQVSDTARAILSKWFFAEDLESGLDFMASKVVSTPFFMVTGDGIVITPWNEIRLRPGAGRQKGILWTRARAREISSQLEDMESMLSDLISESEGLETRNKGLLEEIACEERGLARLEKDRDRLESEIKAIHRRRERIRDRVELQDLERGEVREELLHLEKELSAAEEGLSLVLRKEEDVSQRLEKMEEAFRKAEREKQGLRDLLQVLSVEKAGMDAELKGIEGEISRLEDQVERSEDLSVDMQREISILSQREKLLLRQIKDGSRRKQSLADRELGLLKSLREKEDLLEGLRSRRTELEGARKQLAAGLSSVRDKLHETDLELSRLSREREHLEEACSRELRKEIQEEHDFPPGLSGIGVQKADEMLSALREKIERIGPVNLTAIDEFRELEERRSFLKEQEEDLRASMDDIQKAIDRIDRQCKRKFKQALEDINQSLERVFPLLFDGGRAALGLDNPGNILESGVEFLIEIPGKRIKHPNLLSGGEKALSALALIFAIFFIKPAPFCLLDEVDAPLDDANTGRFNRLVRKISLRSQVILVTHNQRVMETADTLYGVTMEEKGVSKLISVSLE